MPKDTIRLSIFAKLLLGLASILLILLAYSYWHFHEHLLDERRIEAIYLDEYASQVDTVMRLHRQGLEVFVYDYSWWDEMVDFVNHPTDDKWEVIGEDVPQIFGVDVVWVVNESGEQTYGYDTRREVTTETVMPFSGTLLPVLLGDNVLGGFFLNDEGTVYEIVASKVHYGEDEARTGIAEGYLVAARIWDQALVESLEDILGADVVFEKDNPNAWQFDLSFTDYETGDLRVIKLARDYRGEPAFAFSISHNVPGLVDEAMLLDWHSVLVFVIMSLICLFFAFIVYRWVIRPLTIINTALEAEDSPPTSSLARYGREWERMSSLISESIEQRKALKEEVYRRTQAEESLVESDLALRQQIEERERLGRDLHDGIIQSVYAVGLQLETARLKMQADTTMAEGTLLDVRETLNELIAEIRRFIGGLPSEGTALPDIRDSLERLSKTLELGGLTLRYNLDDSALDSLNTAQMNELFFILHELVSNAFRHGQAKEISIELHRRSDGLECLISDDGIGLQDKPIDTFGNGLKNIQYRADILGAKVHYDFDNTQGCKVMLKLQNYL